MKNGEKIRRRKVASARKAEKRAKGIASPKKGCRALSKEEIGLATWIFVRAFRLGVRQPYAVDRRELEHDTAIDALVPAGMRKAKWLSDAAYDLRMAVPMWGEVRSGSVRMELSYIKVERTHNSDDACVESFHGHGISIDAVSGTTSLAELNQLADGDPDTLSEIVYRWHRREQAKRAVAVVLGTATLVGCALFAPKLVRWVRSLSRIEHVQPAPPKPLGGGIVVEGCARPAGELEREVLATTTRDIGDYTLVWDAGGTLTLARSAERERYIRWGPDTDWHWTWTFGIDGAVHTYITTSPTIRLRGASGKRVTYTSSAKEWATLSLRGIGTASVGDANYPIGDTPITDGRVTVSKTGGVTAPEGAHLLNSRETWRAPMIRYECDAALACTFTLAPGPWHPCWQRVEVAFGDGARVDTRSAPAEVLAPVTWPHFLPTDEPWFGYKDVWDRTRLRARHQFARAGTYPLAFWISPADPRSYRGPCTPGPPASQEERLRRFEHAVEIAPNAHGKYPPNAGM